MSYYNWNEEVAPAPRVGVDVQQVLQWVYLWMALGALVTAGVAFLTVQSTTLSGLLLGSPAVVIGAFIVELLLVFGLSAGMSRLSPAAASVMFFVYAAINGFTLSAIFFIYDIGSIVSAFAATAALFGAMSIVGFTTHIDLTRWGSFLFMGLIGVIIAMVVNMFLGIAALDMVISIAGVLIFTGLTAYDTQKIRRMATSVTAQGEGTIAMKLSILGALTLYLDFINLFLFLLRLLGGRRR